MIFGNDVILYIDGAHYVRIGVFSEKFQDLLLQKHDISHKVLTIIDECFDEAVAQLQVEMYKSVKDSIP